MIAFWVERQIDGRPAYARSRVLIWAGGFTPHGWVGKTLLARSKISSVSAQIQAKNRRIIKNHNEASVCHGMQWQKGGWKGQGQSALSLSRHSLGESGFSPHTLSLGYLDAMSYWNLTDVMTSQAHSIPWTLGMIGRAEPKLHAIKYHPLPLFFADFMLHL